MSKNLFETYEVNGRQYTDNLGHNAFINIPKEQYIEYEQLKEENKQLKEKIDKAIEWVKKNQYYFPKPSELLEILGGKENEDNR